MLEAYIVMEEFRNYDILYPELVYDILNYFRPGNRISETNDKTIQHYCETSRFSKAGELIQPNTVHVLCENLVRNGILMNITNKVGMLDFVSNYLFSPPNEAGFLQKHPAVIHKLNCVAYGFRYIYNTFRPNVLPVIVKKHKDVYMGTCFKFRNGILTAKHCLEGDEIAITGYTAETLNNSKVLVSKTLDVDMAYIETGETSFVISDDANILDEVLVMGYPRIPQFFDFCAAERAAISSIPTRGAVASLAGQYITPTVGQLMLVTARIRGGNSGGPIINSGGAVIGVAFSEPKSEGDYDDMGYGVAYPMSVFDQILQTSTTLKVKFVDKIES